MSFSAVTDDAALLGSHRYPVPTPLRVEPPVSVEDRARMLTISRQLSRVDGKNNLVLLIDAMEQNLAEGLRMRWEEAVAAERVVDLIAAEFGGEDPLKPHTRAGLEHAKEIAEQLSSRLRHAGREIEVTVADDEVLNLKEMLERVGCVFRMN